MPELHAPSDDEPVPVFGSWKAIYGAVVVCAVLVMLAVAAFSRWPF
jgi:hypothetical protein